MAIEQCEQLFHAASKPRKTSFGSLNTRQYETNKNILRLSTHLYIYFAVRLSVRVILFLNLMMLFHQKNLFTLWLIRR